MTTIAYKGGVLAADTLGTRNGMRDGVSTKILARDGLLAGAAGASQYCRAFRDWFAKGCIGECPNMGDPEKDWGEGFVIRPDETIITFGPSAAWVDKPYGGLQAWGSGAEIALGAMAAGATADQAVAIAMKYDTKSGGEITVLHR